jgi:hypothetical protein
MKAAVKSLLLLIAAFAVLSLPVLAPAAVHAQGVADAAVTGDGLTLVLHRLVNIFSAIVGVIAVFMIMVGGLKYITSGGESAKVSGARNTIIYAIVGLVIVALSQYIVAFVLSNAAGL